MVVIMRSEAMRYSISVRTELASDLPRVMGDPVQLQQVLMNLMTNSPQNVEGRKQKLIGRFWVTPEVYRASFVESDVRTEVLAPVGSSAGADLRTGNAWPWDRRSPGSNRRTMAQHGTISSPLQPQWPQINFKIEV